MSEQGKLVIQKGNGDKISYGVLVKTKKGEGLMRIYESAIYFDTAKVVDGDIAEVERSADGGRIVKCVVPGKEGEPKPAAPSGKNTDTRQGNVGYSSRGRNMSGNKSPVQKAGNRTTEYPALVNATAPYNFIPYDPRIISLPFQEERRIFSGSVEVNLEGLTPLLVSRAQNGSKDKPAECRFLKMDGKFVIPGSSIKGMLRSLVEIFSFSAMRQISKEPLFWRDLTSNVYRKRFGKEDGGDQKDEKILGGYLLQKGADWMLTPVNVRKIAHGAAVRAGFERVVTGGIKTKDKNTGKWVESADYEFASPLGKEAILLDDKIQKKAVHDFLLQITQKQQAILDARKKDSRYTREYGFPVFYMTDSLGQITGIGLCRYFRIPYKFTPYALAFPDGEEPARDFAEEMFGTVRGEALKGRVSVETCLAKGVETGPIPVVLGGPKPTCLPMYLRQHPATVKTMSRGTKNKPDSMKNYNNSDARLRGRKLYWHHNADEKHFPKGNDNERTQSKLYPLKEGASAHFIINFDRLRESELGALLMALELPGGQSHKLGMGKPLGFGSIRLSIEKLSLRDCSKCYTDLAARLGGDARKELDFGARENLRRKFREKIFNNLQKMSNLPPEWKNAPDYESLPPIRALRIMLDWERKPSSAQVATMKLNEKADGYVQGSPTFALHAILPDPASVIQDKGNNRP